MRRQARHLLEALLFLLAWGFFRALPLDVASWLGGRLGGLIGPRLAVHRIALINLGLAFPEKPKARRKAIAANMWNHLGRTAAEFFHLPGNALYARISFFGLENTPERRAIFVSGHVGNWELAYPAAYEHGVPVALIYRHANNPYIDRMIAHLRRSHAEDMLPKGHRGAARVARAFRRGQSLAMLVDQKMNDGIAVKFFGHEAMCAPAFAQFALRYGIPIVPARVARTKGAHFTFTLYPPLAVENSGDWEGDAYRAVQAMNRMLEGWIRERPEQWLWIHRRWPKEYYAKPALPSPRRHGT